jgi:hypothetical protein
MLTLFFINRLAASNSHIKFLIEKILTRHVPCDKLRLITAYFDICSGYGTRCGVFGTGCLCGEGGLPVIRRN